MSYSHYSLISGGYLKVLTSMVRVFLVLVFDGYYFFLESERSLYRSEAVFFCLFISRFLVAGAFWRVL